MIDFINNFVFPIFMIIIVMVISALLITMCYSIMRNVFKK